MGFLQAIHSLGVMASRRNENSALADITNFLQLPHPLGEPEDRRAYVIRVWLDVVEPESEVLEVQGISRIDQVEYMAIGDREEKIRERCLYREPVGRNVQWRFSPLYKLGKGSKDPTKELLGKGWQTDTDCRFYKLSQSVLKDYEETTYEELKLKPGCYTFELPECYIFYLPKTPLPVSFMKFFFNKSLS